MESQSPGATWGWACGLDPTRAVGERKESDKVRGERVRDTRGSAYANWLGGQGESGGEQMRVHVWLSCSAVPLPRRWWLAVLQYKIKRWLL